jgi:hypothetical protein
MKNANNYFSSALDNVKALVKARIAAHLHPGATAAPIVGQDFTLPGMELASPAEKVITVLALAPHLQPAFFESIIAEQFPQGGDFPEFGGIKAGNHRGMVPTGETVQFILGGMDIGARLEVARLFNPDHYFHKLGMLWLEPVKEGEPKMSGRLTLSQEWTDKLLHGNDAPIPFGPEFPARRINTTLEWNDMVLHTQTDRQLRDISTWLRYRDVLATDSNLGRKIKPGYRALFYGPPGTGKTMAASLLGKQFGKDVYRVDLSQVVSKYIGETEKNLERIFSKAESKDWILFFDEADALFGKRTGVKDAHDKYANQEVSYLLQRVEEFNGLIILASNYKGNMDEAFLRRFNAIVHFPMPNAAERLQIWQKSIPSSIPCAKDVDLKDLAQRYELNGSSILNVMHHASLNAHARGGTALSQSDLLDGIQRELAKEEKSM